MTGNGTATVWPEILRLGQEQATTAGHVRELREELGADRRAHQAALRRLGQAHSHHARQIAELQRSRRSWPELVKSLFGSPRSLLIGWGLAVGFMTGNLTYSDLMEHLRRELFRALGWG